MQNNKLHLSDGLVDVLTRIQDASVIAKQLLDLSEDLSSHPVRDDYADYISLSVDVDGMISFVSPSRVQAIRDKGSNFEFDIWNSKMRYRSRPAAVVQKILQEFRSRDLEIFSNVFKSALGLTKFTFKQVSGSEIRDWYHYSCISELRGSLANSCMKYDHCQDYFRIYTQNVEKISMLLMVNSNNKLMGRALLWTFEDVKVMDRIYTIDDDELVYHFKHWAQENGYLYKPLQRWNNSLDFVENGQQVKKRFSIKLKFSRFSKYPYLDTFKFLDSRNGILTNHKTENTDMVLIQADGGWSEADILTEDYIDGVYHHTSEMVPLIYDINTRERLEEPVYTHSGNACYSSVNSQFIYNNHAKSDDILLDHIFNQEFDHLNNHQAILQTAISNAKQSLDIFLKIMLKKNKTDLLSILKSKEEFKQQWCDKHFVESNVREMFANFA